MFLPECVKNILAQINIDQKYKHCVLCAYLNKDKIEVKVFKETSLNIRKRINPQSDWIKKDKIWFRFYSDQIKEVCGCKFDVLFHYTEALHPKIYIDPLPIDILSFDFKIKP